MTAFEAICLIAAMVAALVGLIGSPRTYDLPANTALLAAMIGEEAKPSPPSTVTP